VKASSRPDVPLIWSEYNASYKNEVEVTDSTYMASWLADTIRQCDGLVDVLAYWAFSDVFDEQGVVKEPFYGGFGLVATGGVPKPAYNAFALLHRLGSKRIVVANESVLVTVRDNGSLAIALWNLAAPGSSGPDKQFKLKITGLAGKRRIMVRQVDDNHGSFWPVYKHMGEPHYPTQAQYDELRKAAELRPGQARDWNGGVVEVTLPAHALALIEIETSATRASSKAAHTKRQ